MRISKTLISNSLILLSLASPLATPGWAADEKKSENLKDDIRFSRDLARYRYFDLAVDWLAAIERAGGMDEEAKTEVSLAKATISQMASEYALTRDVRKAFYDDAVKHFGEAVEGMGEAMTREKGNAVVEGYAKVLVNKGKFYTDEITRMKSEEADAATIKEVVGEAEAAFRLAMKTLNGAYGDLSSAADDMVDSGDEEEAQNLQELSLQALYRKGEAYYFWALLYQPQDFNREDYLSKCAESLVDYIWEAGDESIFSLYAYYFQGMAEWELGKVQPDSAAAHDEKALASLVHIFSEYGIDVNQLTNLAEQDRVFVQGLLEQAYRGVSDIYRNAAQRIENMEGLADTEDMSQAAASYQVAGDKPWMAKDPVFKPALIKALRGGAIAMITDMERRLSAHKLKLTEQGWRALLSKAYAMREAGSPEEALTIATDVAENNERSLVGLEAQNLLGGLLEQTDEDAQPASVLRLVSDGYIAETRWLDAIGALHGVVAACKSDEDKAQYLFKAWEDIGACYQSEGRNLEAAMAFEAGLELARSANDSLATGDLALGAYNAWDRRFRETKHDFDKKERNRVRDIVTSLGISGDIQFLVAREAFSNATATKGTPEEIKKGWDTAINELKAVAQTSSYYERALVYLARAYAESGDRKKSIETFDALFRRIGDEKFAVGLDKKKAQQRDFASAEAVFYRAGVLLDQSEFQDVFDSLVGYEGKFEGQAPYFPNVVYYRIRAQVGMGQIGEAEELLSAMVANYEGHATIAYATNQVATGHFKAYQELEDKKTEGAVDHLRRAAGYLDQYNSMSGYASFQNLRNVADWYKEIGELKLAEENYQRLRARFGKKPNHTKTIEESVLPALADVLLRLHKFQEALPLWRQVYAANSRDRTVVHSFALCLGGWMDEKEDRGVFEYTEITGAGEYNEAMGVWIELKKGIEDAGDKGTPDWWDCMTGFLYCQYMEGKSNPQMKKAALRLIANWKAVLPDLGGDPFKRRIKMFERALSR